MEYSVEAFSNVAYDNLGNEVKVKGIITWASKASQNDGGYWHHTVMVADVGEEETRILKISVNGKHPNGGYQFLKVNYAFSGEVQKNKNRKGNQLPFSMWKGKLLGCDDKVANGKIEHDNRKALDERRIAPVVGMLYNNDYQKLSKDQSLSIGQIHNEVINAITRKRIQDVLDLTDKFLHPKSEAVKQAEEVFEEDPFAGE